MKDKSIGKLVLSLSKDKGVKKKLGANFNKPMKVLYIFIFCIFCFNHLVEGEVNPVNDFIILHPLYGQKKLVVDFDFKKVVEIDVKNVTGIELVLKHSSKSKIVERKIKQSMSDGQFQAIFDMKDVPSGVCQIKAIVKDIMDYQVGDEYVNEFTWLPKELEQFKWLGSKAGITNEVLAPWIPIEIEKGKEGLIVKVWGRAYYFKESPFPARIETKGNSILAKPVQIIAKVDGKTVSLQWSSFKIEKQTSGIISFSQKALGGGLNLSAVTQIEYDGMIRVDWKIIPERSLKLEELTVEIPMNSKYAEYMYTPGFIDRVGFVPKDGWVHSFIPMLWLGNDECGLEWFCESAKDWYNVKIYKQIEILPEVEEVKLRLYIIDEPIKMEPGVKVKHELGIPVMASADKVIELSYTFGFQATPVKPMKEDVWDYRFVHTGAGNHGIPATPGSDDRFNIPEATLNSWVNSGVRTIAMHSQWTDYAGYTSTPYPEALKRCVKTLHERGFKFILYLFVSMSSIVPEWPFFKEECMVNPKTTTEFWRKGYYPPQDAYNVCNNSVNQDLLVYGIGQMIDEYDIDGVYLDGTALTWVGCKNTLHGCGYMKSNGKLSKTFPIFANRELMRRMYTVVKKRKPDGHVNFHNSTEMLAPVLSWVTSYWNGEQFGGRLDFAGIPKSEPMLKKVSLDHFRTEFIGIQWGVAAEFLPYTLIKEGGLQTDVLPLALLHDVPLRGEFMAIIWKIMDAFGRKQAEWLPYWKNKEYVTVNPDNVDVYVSLYKHPKNGVLAVVSNLSDKEAKVKVKLNLKTLKLKYKLSAYETIVENLWADDPIAITDGILELDLDSLKFKIIWIKEEL